MLALVRVPCPSPSVPALHLACCPLPRAAPVPGLCLSARRAIWHKNCALAVSICACLTGQRGAGCHGDRKRLCGLTHSRGLPRLPYAHTAPGDRLVAVSEACLCDSTFPGFMGLLVLYGLSILDVSQRLSPGPSLTAQERGLSRSKSKAPKNGSKPPDMIPAASTGCGAPDRKARCAPIKRAQHGLPVSGALDEATRTALGLTTAQRPPASRPGVVPDAIQEAQTPRTVPAERPEQRQSAHDRSNVFQASQGLPASQALPQQPDQGKILGFDFSRDPLNAKRPMQPFEEIRQADAQAKPKVMAAQRSCWSSRYDLTPKLDPEETMSRGKPLAVGPTARLAAGHDWDKLAA